MFVAIDIRFSAVFYYFELNNLKTMLFTTSLLPLFPACSEINVEKNGAHVMQIVSLLLAKTMVPQHGQQ